MSDKQNIEKLDRIFEEIENVKMSSSELSDSLSSLGFNVHEVVGSGVKEIQKFLPNIFINTSNAEGSSKVKIDDNQYPIAAANDKSDSYDHLNKKKKD